MKKIYITLLMALLLSACASATSPTPIPTIALDGSPSNADQSNTGNEVTASAIIVPVKDAQLSFPAVGHVTEVNAKVGDRVSAGDVLVRIDTSLLEAKVREAEANLAVAEIQVRYLKRIGTNQAHLETAEADVERAQALLDLAKATLDSQSTLVAPFDGVIVSVDIAPAETVTPGQVVIVLADLSRYQIETTDLSERDVTKVQTGQPATVFIEALNGEFTGKVIDIDRIGSTLGGDVVFTVTIAFDQQPQGLLWGMSADARIQTDQ
ncbi:MAG: efflux RND transporter periplasmic adaptor subunit [Anaerolineae bacterium]|nr:efflux RND transporter periplasmic adaptor subunit [Anaerolineae bacterium]